jgi:hypothetical protein
MTSYIKTNHLYRQAWKAPCFNFNSQTKESPYSVPFSVSDEIKSCFEEGTPANITNKFQRCWREIQAKHNNTLPPLIEWNVTLANRKQHETSSQNDTARNVPSTNDTQHGTSPPNKSEQAKAPKSVTKNAPQQNSVTGRKT